MLLGVCRHRPRQRMGGVLPPHSGKNRRPPSCRSHYGRSVDYHRPLGGTTARAILEHPEPSGSAEFERNNLHRGVLQSLRGSKQHQARPNRPPNGTMHPHRHDPRAHHRRPPGTNPRYAGRANLAPQDNHKHLAGSIFTGRQILATGNRAIRLGRTCT